MKTLLAAIAFWITLPWVAALAQDLDPARAELVDRLVLNSATTLRAFERSANEEQIRLYTTLSARDGELAVALQNNRLARAERRRLEDELATVTLDRSRMASQLANQNREFDTERRALREQFSGIAMGSSPERLAALRRFADGDRANAFQLIAEITRAENNARRRASDAAAAQNLLQLLPLTAEMALRGEKTLEDILALLDEAGELDPRRIDIALQRISSNISLSQNTAALAIGEQIRPLVNDPWDIFSLESVLLPARLQVSTYEAARAPFLQAARNVFPDLQLGLDQFAPELRRRWCELARPYFADDTVGILDPQNVTSVASRCLREILNGGNELRGLTALPYVDTLINQLIRAHEYARAREALRGFDEAQIAADMRDFPSLRDGTLLRINNLHFRIAIGEGNYDEALSRARTRASLINALRSLSSVLEAEIERERLVAEGEITILNGDYGAAAALFAQAAGSPQPFDRTVALQSPLIWLSRMRLFSLWGAAAHQAGQHQIASDVFIRSQPVVFAFIGELPPPAEESYAHTYGAVCEFFDIATSLTSIRIGLGDYEAADRLRTLQGFHGEIAQRALFQDCYGPFHAEGHILLGASSFLRGDVERARLDLEDARRISEAARRQYPQSALWRNLHLLARFRIAQINNDEIELNALRAETAALRAAGLGLGPEFWARNLETWRVGDEIRWVPAARQASP